MAGSARSCLEVRLEGLRFHAFHGMLPQETKVGNEFEADVSVLLPDVGAADDDSLDNSLCYAALYELVEQEMQHSSATLEHLAARIGRSILNRWSVVEAIDVSLTKLTPPIPRFRGSAKVVWHYRSDFFDKD